MTTVIVAIALAQCPLIGTNPEEIDLSKRPPVYPGERTCSGLVGMSGAGMRHLARGACQSRVICFKRRQQIDPLQPRVAPQHLRRLAEGSQEGAAHVVAVAEAGLASDNFDGMTALLHQVSRRLDPQICDRLGGRLTCLGVERRLN